MFPRDTVCLRNIRVDSLNKGDIDDDDDNDDDNNNNNNNNLHPNTYMQKQKSVILGTFSITRNFLNYK